MRLALGLPSTTAIVLVVCGCERGIAAATEMAGSSLLGLAAAVALPLAYAQAVRLGWRLPGALAAAVTGYLVVASTLGCLPAPGIASSPRHRAFRHRVGRLLGAAPADPGGESRRGRAVATGRRWACARPSRRSMSWCSGSSSAIAGPGWAGLVSTFPSMSLVVLAVTHLEAGPAEASRIARVLPLGNTSTLAFLAAFHVMSTNDRPGRRDHRRLRRRGDGARCHRAERPHPRPRPSRGRRCRGDLAVADRPRMAWRSRRNAARWRSP